jgi:hypothetical protein
MYNETIETIGSRAPDGWRLGYAKPESVPRPAFVQPTNSRGGTIERFTKLLKQWRAETGAMALVRDKLNHQAFQEIVSMGPSVVPMIFEEIRFQPDFLVLALPKILGSNIVQPTGSGSLREIVDAWLLEANRRDDLYRSDLAMA